MKWSKLKTVAESHLAESLRNKIFYHMTRYGARDSYTMARAWIVYEKKEIVSFSEVLWMGKNQELASKIFAELQMDESIELQNDPHPWWDARRQASELLASEGIFSTEHFIHALYEFVNLSIAESVNNSDPLIRAFAVVDKRIGKRRLNTLINQNESIIVKRMLTARWQAEGLDDFADLYKGV